MDTILDSDYLVNERDHKNTNKQNSKHISSNTKNNKVNLNDTIDEFIQQNKNIVNTRTSENDSADESLQSPKIISLRDLYSNSSEDNTESASVRKQKADIVKHLAIQRGKRLKDIRTKLLGLSLQKIAENCGLHIVAWRRFESGKVPLKSPIAEMLCMKFGEYGVFVSLTWLLSGLGPEPKLIRDGISMNKYQNIDSIISTLKPVLEDFHQMKQQNENNIAFHNSMMLSVNRLIARTFNILHADLSIACVINDKHMEPKYIKGAKVFGYWIDTNDYQRYRIEGMDCIIKRENNIIMVRRIFHGDNDSDIMLSCYDTAYRPELVNLSSIKIGIIVAVTDTTYNAIKY